jgi:hypothetical protein
MRTLALRCVVLAVLAAAIAVTPAVWAQDETFAFTVDAVRLAADRHTVVVSGTYTCGPMDLNVVGGGGTVDLTVRQGQVTGFGFVPIQVCDGTAQPYQAEVTTFGTVSSSRARPGSVPRASSTANVTASPSTSAPS